MVENDRWAERRQDTVSVSATNNYLLLVAGFEDSKKKGAGVPFIELGKARLDCSYGQACLSCLPFIASVLYLGMMNCTHSVPFLCFMFTLPGRFMAK